MAVACPLHVLGVDRVAGQLEHEVRLDRLADVRGATRVDRPTAALELPGPNVAARAVETPEIETLYVPARQVVEQQEVFRLEDRVALELGAPVAVVLL